MNIPKHMSAIKSQGFSLIELMVSVVIGLLGVVVIFQVLSVWDARKRTTAAGSDAQVAGTIGVFALERDLKVVGYGMGRINPAELNCNVRAINATGANSNFPLVPAMITQGVNSTPDQLSLLYGSSDYFTAVERFKKSTPTTKEGLRFRIGLFPGDLVVVTNAPDTPAAASCELVEITSAALDERIEHASVDYVRFGEPAGAPPLPSKFNPPGGAVTVFARGNLYNLGPAPRRHVWQIRAGGVLSVTEQFAAGAMMDVAEGIVDLQAEYGTLNVAGVIDWSDAAPANWSELQAIRVALLARSQQFERDAVTIAAPRFFNGTRSFAMANVFGAESSVTIGAPTNWQNYRYRVYEKIVPLRNVMWGKT
jgi:type IV pilus assembly protein PilW